MSRIWMGKLLTGVLSTGLVAGSFGSLGCIGHAQPAREVYVEPAPQPQPITPGPGPVVQEDPQVYVELPPAPPHEEWGPRPGPNFVWIQGHYRRREGGGGWRWIPGHWERPPYGYRYWVSEHYVRVPGGWRLVGGHWN